MHGEHRAPDAETAVDLLEGVADRAEPAGIKRKAILRLELRIEVPLGEQGPSVVGLECLRVVEKRAIASGRRGEMQLNLAPLRQIPVEEGAVQPQGVDLGAALAF